MQCVSSLGWASEGGQGRPCPLDLKNFGKICCFLVPSGKNKVHDFWLLLENLLEKSTGPPLEKILPTPMIASGNLFSGSFQSHQKLLKNTVR